MGFGHSVGGGRRAGNSKAEWTELLAVVGRRGEGFTTSSPYIQDGCFHSVFLFFMVRL